MFPNSMFPTSMFPPDYWPKTGGALPTGHGPKVGGKQYYVHQLKAMVEEEEKKNQSLVRLMKKMIFNDLLRMVMTEVYENMELAKQQYESGQGGGGVVGETEGPAESEE